MFQGLCSGNLRKLASGHYLVLVLCALCSLLTTGTRGKWRADIPRCAVQLCISCTARAWWALDPGYNALPLLIPPSSLLGWRDYCRFWCHPPVSFPTEAFVMGHHDSSVALFSVEVVQVTHHYCACDSKVRCPRQEMYLVAFFPRWFMMSLGDRNGS